MPGAGARGGAGRRGGLGRRDRPAARGDSVRCEGPVRLGRRTNRLRLADLRRPHSGPRRGGDPPRPCRGCRPGREDADARVRVGDHVGERAAGVGAQPLGDRPGLRRLERRIGGRARRRRAAPDARERHRRLDPDPGGVLRRRRPEADLRPDQRRRRVAARPLPRPPGADGAHSGRRGAAARGRRRGRPGRPGDRGRRARRPSRRARARRGRPRRRGMSRPAHGPALRRRERGAAPPPCARWTALEPASSSCACPRRRSRTRPSSSSSARRRSTRIAAPACGRRGAPTTAPTCSGGSSSQPR